MKGQTAIDIVIATKDKQSKPPRQLLRECCKASLSLSSMYCQYRSREVIKAAALKLIIAAIAMYEEYIDDGQAEMKPPLKNSGQVLARINQEHGIDTK